jgi:hypothetical protein
MLALNSADDMPQLAPPLLYLGNSECEAARSIYRSELFWTKWLIVPAPTPAIHRLHG